MARRSKGPLRNQAITATPCCLYSDAAPSAVVSFSDGRCEADGVCPNDPLLFTCEVNEVVVLRVVFPTGDSDILSDDDDEDDVTTPPGFTAVSFEATVIDGSSRNFVLILSVASASLLAGGNITCDDTTENNRVMAGCPLLGTISGILYNKSSFSECNTMMAYELSTNNIIITE